MSDTDILVHMVKGGIFFKIVPYILDLIYITPKVEDELKASHSHIYYQLLNEINKGQFLRRTKDTWNDLSIEQKKTVNQTKSRMRPKLDPGELDCYAYSVGMEIDAIISNDKQAKEIISVDSEGEKVVITFWDLLILAIKNDLISWEVGEDYYNQVVDRCGLTLPPFGRHIERFDDYCGKHKWVKDYLSNNVPNK
ncbi:hypothetical protein [Bacillus sp. AFS041924]|uniref:hypothetical protein n=1 Tax=Bacillus sp. AFS041924 TaxID=2033503 RepID=UPI001145B549|nr:hypothetical protein [Bacillus sp. AFS041924]